MTRSNGWLGLLLVVSLAAPLSAQVSYGPSGFLTRAEYRESSKKAQSAYLMGWADAFRLVATDADRRWLLTCLVATTEEELWQLVDDYLYTVPTPPEEPMFAVTYLALQEPCSPRFRE